MKKMMKYCLALALGLAVASCSTEPQLRSGDGRSSSGDVGRKKVKLWKGGPYWAETNIGAEKPWDRGYYFWWGDTIGYKRVNNAWVASDGSSASFSFNAANVPTNCKDKSKLRKEGWVAGDGVLVPKHDAAHVHWGGDWRMPTSQELQDLCDKCDWKWKTLNGVNGYVVRGRGDYGSASIFLPCAGAGDETKLDGDGTIGFYWSSATYTDEDDYEAWDLNFDSSSPSTDGFLALCGMPVRPVLGGSK